MRGLYLSNINPQSSIGYMSKIIGQVKGFCKLNCSMDLICFNHNLQVIQTSYEHQSGQPLGTRIISPAKKGLFKRRISLIISALRYIGTNKFEFIYLRYPRSEPLLIFFIWAVKKYFPNCIILSEIPTYPYEKEYTNSILLREKIVFILDKFTRQSLKYFIDRIISINYNSPIFGIDVISIDNGINSASYSVIDYDKSIDTIHITGVANINSWHGFDRVLSGLSHYYRNVKQCNQKVVFHIVSPHSSHLDKLVELALSEDIAEFVVFHEAKQGNELDTLFSECHLAVGVLGGHRKDLNIMSPLKNREYCARGIPFIFSHIDPDFPKSFKYCLQIDPDDSPLDIQKLIEFTIQLSKEKDISSKMRSYACETLDWSIKLKPVKAYIDKQVSQTSLH